MSLSGKNRNLLIFMVSLFISGFLWILVAFEKSYNTTIPLHIIFRENPENKILKTSLPDNPYIVANLRGWDIIKYKRINKSITLDIDIQDYRNIHFVVLSALKKNDPLNELKVLRFYPDTIYLDFEKGVTKMVPVQPLLDISYSDEYGIAGKIEVTPDHILIKTGKSTADHIDTLFTEKIVLKKLQSTTTVQAKIIAYGNNVTLGNYKVTVKIPVEKYTEGEIILPIQIQGNENSLSLIPDKARITYQTPLSNYKLIDSSTFILYVEQNDYETNKKLKVKSTTNNDFIFNIRIEPAFVDFVIKK